MNVVLLGFAGTEDGLFVDPVPAGGHFSLDLPVGTGPTAFATPGFAPSTARPPWRGPVRRRPHLTSNR
jgi:hypothetical protein